MANNYFQFKQFTIHQDHCAMKVCTDACIFGAFVARQISNRNLVTSNILDIGTGTGLLSLMLAQKIPGAIDAIEIDKAAFEQAKQNFEQSPWKNQLTIVNTDATQFNGRKKFDCIISNPPFFEGDLKSANHKKNAAKHDTTFTLDQLLSVIDNNLSPRGFFAVLLPWHRADFFIEMAGTSHYFLNQQLLVKHTSNHPYFRAILLFSRDKSTIISKELVIKESGGNYTLEFIEMLKDYYLEEGLRLKVDG